MNRRPALFQKLLVIFLTLTLSSFSLLTTNSTTAKTTARAAGELSFVRQATLNGAKAISGMTVFSESRVKTSLAGAATVNLNKLGGVGFGSDTEMMLHFSEDVLGGSLLSGRVVVRAPAGVKISVVTPQGVAQSDGRQASVLAIDVVEGKTRVASSLGDAQVTSGSRIEYVAEGKEVLLGAKGANKVSRTKNPAPAVSSDSGSTQQSGGGGILLPVVVASISLTTAAIIATTLNRSTARTVSPIRPQP